MQMYARAVNFKNRNIDSQSWIEQCNEWTINADTPMLKILKRKKLDSFSNAVSIFVGVMYTLDEQSIDLNWMIQLFSKNNLESKRMRQEIRTPEFKPVKQGILCIDVSPRGSVFLYPSPEWMDENTQQKKIKQHIIKLPSTLKMEKHQDIHPCTLFYNPDVNEQVETIKNLLEPKAFSTYKKKMMKNGQLPGVTILLSGGPGTGKTELAKQIALQTKRNLLFFDVAEQRNMFYGESEKKIAEVFQCYEMLIKKSKQEDILFFNEADSVIQNRSTRGDNTHQTEVAIQTLLLNAMENFKGILIATTNRPESFDKAFQRRFLFHIEIQQPQEVVRMHLLQHRFPQLNEQTIKNLAVVYTFTGAELEVFTRHWQINEIVNGNVELTTALEEFLKKNTQGIKRVRKPIGFQWY
jgi:adenylate kinase family enzyme